jgi:hypothetical protein
VGFMLFGSTAFKNPSDDEKPFEQLWSLFILLGKNISFVCI